jgi:predicted SprT family Zn-dependent metalloprotease
MRIPKTFKLMGHTIDVHEEMDLHIRQNSTGEAHYRSNKIYLQGQEGYPLRPISKVEQDFCHELMHFILYMGECSDTNELWKNEHVVNRLSSLLHQALTTMEYEE